MRIVFFGTPDFARRSLEVLLESRHEVVAVVCQPDQPAGRGKKLTPPATKVLATSRGLPVLQPTKLRDPELHAELRAFEPEIFVVAAYGRILPRRLLELPPRGAINVHASLLPRHRGAAPIQRAILAGDPETGVTIQQMNERMDAGDVLALAREPIGPDDTAGALFERLAELGAQTMVTTLADLARGAIVPAAQDESAVTLAPRIDKEEARVDWTRSAEAIERAVRAFHPAPGAFTTLDGRRIKLHRTSVGDATGEPGVVLTATGDRIEIATGEGSLLVHDLQLEGRNRLGARDFLASRLLVEGTRLDRAAR